jgi:hypothetical protein
VFWSLLILVLELGLRHRVVDAVLGGDVLALPVAAAAVSGLEPDLVVAVTEVLLALVRPGVDHAVLRALPLLGLHGGRGLGLHHHRRLHRRGSLDGCRRRGALLDSGSGDGGLGGRLLGGLLLGLLGSLLGLLLGLLGSLLGLLLGLLGSLLGLLLRLLLRLLGLLSLLLRGSSGGLLGGGGLGDLLAAGDAGGVRDLDSLLHVGRLELLVERLVGPLLVLGGPALLAEGHGVLVDELAARGCLLRDGAVVDVGAVVEDGARHLDLLLLLLARDLVLLGLVHGEGLPAVLEGVLEGEVHPGTRLAQLGRDHTLRHAARLLGGGSAPPRDDALNTLLSLGQGELHDLQQVSSVQGLQRGEQGVHLDGLGRGGGGLNGGGSRELGGRHLGGGGLGGRGGGLESLGVCLECAWNRWKSLRGSDCRAVDRLDCLLTTPTTWGPLAVNFSLNLTNLRGGGGGIPPYAW